MTTSTNPTNAPIARNEDDANMNSQFRIFQPIRPEGREMEIEGAWSTANQASYGGSMLRRNRERLIKHIDAGNFLLVGVMSGKGMTLEDVFGNGQHGSTNWTARHGAVATAYTNIGEGKVLPAATSISQGNIIVNEKNERFIVADFGFINIDTGDKVAQ